MPSHKFKVGQPVRLTGSSVGRGVAGRYKVVALLPEERGEFQYRLQGFDTPQQRVAWESQLSKVDAS